MEAVHDGVALAPGDESTVHRDRDDERDREARAEAPPEQSVGQPGGERAGHDQDEGVVDELHRRDRDGVERQPRHARAARWERPRARSGEA